MYAIPDNAVREFEDCRCCIPVYEKSASACLCQCSVFGNVSVLEYDSVYLHVPGIDCHESAVPFVCRSVSVQVTGKYCLVFLRVTGFG